MIAIDALIDFHYCTASIHIFTLTESSRKKSFFSGPLTKRVWLFGFNGGVTKKK